MPRIGNWTLDLIKKFSLYKGGNGCKGGILYPSFGKYEIVSSFMLLSKRSSRNNIIGGVSEFNILHNRS